MQKSSTLTVLALALLVSACNGTTTTPAITDTSSSSAMMDNSSSTAPMNSSSSVPQKGEVTMQWKIHEYTNADIPKTDLTLVIRGDVSTEVSVGGLTGSSLQPNIGVDNIMAYSTWYAGGGDAYYVVQKDATHVAVMHMPLEEDPEAKPVAEEMRVIEIPTTSTVKVLDNFKY